MNILVFYQYFSTPKGNWGTRYYEFGRYWAEKGHNVEIITSVYVKSDIKPRKFIDIQYFEGIKVTMLNIRLDNKDSMPKRLWGFITYTIIASYFALSRKADVVIASSGPISVGLSGLLAKWLRKLPFVFEIRDIWPDGAIHLGIIKNKTLIRFVKYFEKILYSAADVVIGLSPGMQKYVKEGFSHPNVVSITNGANIDFFCNEYQVPQDLIIDSKYALYAGNIGKVNNSMLLLNACRILKEKGREDIKILFIGDGQEREKICKIAKDETLKSFEYRPLMPKTTLVGYLQNAMVSLVPLHNHPIWNSSSPNKLFESLAAGIPVIQTTNGWIKDYLHENRAGYTLSHHDAEELADILIKISDYPDKLADLKSNAKMCARRDFNHEFLAQTYLESLHKLVYG